MYSIVQYTNIYTLYSHTYVLYSTTVLYTVKASPSISHEPWTLHQFFTCGGGGDRQASSHHTRCWCHPAFWLVEIVVSPPSPIGPSKTAGGAHFSSCLAETRESGSLIYSPNIQTHTYRTPSLSYTYTVYIGGKYPLYVPLSLYLIYLSLYLHLSKLLCIFLLLLAFSSISSLSFFLSLFFPPLCPPSLYSQFSSRSLLLHFCQTNCTRPEASLIVLEFTIFV